MTLAVARAVKPQHKQTNNDYDFSYQNFFNLETYLQTYMFL